MTESKSKSTISRYAGKAKSGIGTAVSKARSGASSAATKVGSGVSSAVGAIKQRVGSDGQDPTQNGAVAPAGGSSTEQEMPSPEESHAEEARLHVSPTEETEVDTSFSNGAVDLAFTDGETTVPGTRVHVSLDNDIPDVSPGEDGSVTVGLGSDAGTTMAVSPAENDEVDRSFGNGDIQLSLNDGNVRVAPGDNEIQMETGDNGDVQFAVGDAPLTGEPSNDLATERDPEAVQNTTPPSTSNAPRTEQQGQSSVRDDAIAVTEATTNGHEPTRAANDKWLGPNPPENRPDWMEQTEEQASDERQNGYDRNNDERDEDPSPNGGHPDFE
ncbi:hypothetical protein [Halocatena salina]|uniref:Uncharacterized protein n=1 Tax=Halocatena salina TaxID=2934340 RepID=A0A8U0A1L3_9EURY|nr:hypothetical protein [Halocatena salina]UPM43071.1 hypothetical protein MW046_01145 [Halocatena salina]